jgi:hypothetical protein
MLNDIYYSVNGEKIYNPYLAFVRGATTSYHHFPEFKFMPGVFDLANIEPEESFEQLCNQRAAQLRAKYDYLVLAFSGGTDSFTVYDSFVRNNIHIDHIICNYMETDCGHDKGAADWLVANHQDPRTKIVIQDPNKVPPVTFCSEDWVYENRAINNRYRHYTPNFELVESCRLAANGKSFAVITGLEKPHLMLDRKQWYMTFLDDPFRIVMGIDNQESFFITDELPKLHIKQCHMLARFLTTYAKSKTTKTFFTSPLEHKINYMQWARATGRIGEAVANNSLTQKLTHKIKTFQISTASTDLVPGYNPSIALLNEHALDNNTNVKNFLAGINNLQTNTLMKQYLHNHGIIQDVKSTVVVEHTSLISTPIWLGSLDD